MVILLSNDYDSFIKKAKLNRKFINSASKEFHVFALKTNHCDHLVLSYHIESFKNM